MKNDPQMSSALAASQDSDDELDDCPICVEPFDESDRLFLPCQCNYRVCMFCVRRLMTEFDGRCPGCRSVYNEANFRIREMDPEEMEKRKQREKQRNLERARQQQMKNSASSSMPAGSTPSGTQNKLVRQGSAGAITSTTGAPPGKRPVGPPAEAHLLSPLKGPQSGNGPSQGGEHSEAALAQQRKNLATVRVVQHHVVFVLGLPMSLAKEEILRRPEHFGQYGPIVKIVVGHPASAPGRTASASAHITFQRVEDAREAIRGVDGIVLDGHQIRASFGTTRYCHAFLRGQQCHNPECLFLHQEVDPSAQTMPNPQTTTTGANANTTGTNQTNGNGTTGHHTRAGSAPAGSAGSEGKSHVAPPGSFGGTDPFALESVPEPLNGIDLAQFEKQKANSKTPITLTKGRAPGSERPQPAAMPPQAPSYDCALSFIAELVAGRTIMPEDLRRKMLWLAGPRAKSSQFSGLGCILSDVNPLFVAPLAAPVELKEVPGAEHVVQSAMSTTLATGKDDGANYNSNANNNPAQQTQQPVQDTAKDKKLSRKNKKAAFAAQNRIGGEEGF